MMDSTVKRKGEVGVKMLAGLVKPLVWRSGQALTSTGNYLVVCENWDEEPFWFVLRNGKPDGKMGEHATEEAAKAAAQADFAAKSVANFDTDAIAALVGAVMTFRAVVYAELPELAQCREGMDFDAALARLGATE